MKDFMEDGYVALTAVGIYDRGFKKGSEESRFFGMSGLDTNKDGVIDDSEQDMARARLYQIALDAGAGEILAKFNGVIPKHLCVDFDKGGAIADDDSVLIFNKGETIILNHLFTYPDGTPMYEGATEADVFKGSWDMLRFMEARGLIIGRRFVNKDGTLNLDMLQQETPIDATDTPMTDALIVVDDKQLDSIKSGLDTAQRLFRYLQGAYPVIQPLSILFSIKDYIFDNDIVGSSDKETFLDVLKRVLHV